MNKCEFKKFAIDLFDKLEGMDQDKMRGDEFISNFRCGIFKEQLRSSYIKKFKKSVEDVIKQRASIVGV